MLEILDMAETAIETIARCLRDNVVVVAWSGGKDSSIVLSLAVEAWIRARDRGWHPCPLQVIHGDTGVENPAMVAYAEEAIEDIRERAAERGVEVEVHVYTPTLAASWAARVV